MCVLSHGLLCKINNTIPLTSIGSTEHGANVTLKRRIDVMYNTNKSNGKEKFIINNIF